MSAIEVLNHSGLWLGTIIKSNYNCKEGIEFFTSDEATQQIGAMFRKKDYLIKPHAHQLVPRTINYTTEVLIIKSGKVRIDFYAEKDKYLFSRIVEGGDVALLVEGGHGFKFLEDSLVLEVKQGPYVGVQDKIRFEPIIDEEVKWS